MAESSAEEPAAAQPRPRRARLVRLARFARIALKILATVAVVLLAVVIVLVNGCTRPLAPTLVWVTNTHRQINPAEDERPEAWRRMGVSDQIRVDVGPPAASLSVWVVEPAVPAGEAPPAHPRGCVFLVHGINSNKDSMLGTARHFSRHGYRAFAVDLRAHGRSSGEWASFGVHESDDLCQLLDALSARGLVDAPVCVFGGSLGGAVALEWAGKDPRVRAAVSIASFTSMREIVPIYIRHYLPGLGHLMMNASIQRMIDEAGRIAEFNPDEASPLRAVREAECPILLFHGTDDRHIPAEHAAALHDASAGHSELRYIDGADHTTIFGDPYFTPIMEQSITWLGSHLTAASQATQGPAVTPATPPPATSSPPQSPADGYISPAARTARSSRS